MLIAIRQQNHPRSAPGDGGRRSRFFGSTWWQAYYVELTILGVMVCILLLRPLEYALEQVGGGDGATGLHYPLTGWLGESFAGLSAGTLETAIIVVAAIKILISFAWMITIALTPTMGVAWHRFLAFFNIFFKRHADGRTSLGELQPIKVGGRGARLREGRGARRGRRARGRQGGGLHLEGAARLHHVHRVRPLPEPVPGVEHRQAALAQAARHGAA